MSRAMDDLLFSFLNLTSRSCLGRMGANSFLTIVASRLSKTPYTANVLKHKEAVILPACRDIPTGLHFSNVTLRPGISSIKPLDDHVLTLVTLYNPCARTGLSLTGLALFITALLIMIKIHLPRFRTPVQPPHSIPSSIACTFRNLRFSLDCLNKRISRSFEAIGVNHVFTATCSP
jgi:hypothetical protein